MNKTIATLLTVLIISNMIFITATTNYMSQPNSETIVLSTEYNVSNDKDVTQY